MDCVIVILRRQFDRLLVFTNCGWLNNKYCKAPATGTLCHDRAPTKHDLAVWSQLLSFDQLQHMRQSELNPDWKQDVWQITSPAKHANTDLNLSICKKQPEVKELNP